VDFFGTQCIFILIIIIIIVTMHKCTLTVTSYLTRMPEIPS